MHREPSKLEQATRLRFRQPSVEFRRLRKRLQDLHRNDELVIELPPGETTYSLFVALRYLDPNSGTAVVEIVAFNEFGDSEPATLLVAYNCFYQ
jgi:hypothetical protein